MGAGIGFAGPDVETRALEAWQWALGDFGWDASQLSDLRVAKGSKHLRVFAEQEVQGWPVLGSKVQAKFHDASLVFVSSDWWPELEVVAMSNGISQETIIDALFEEMAVNGSSGNTGTTFVTDFEWEDLGMAWLPVNHVAEGDEGWYAHPVWREGSLREGGGLACPLFDLG